MAPGQVQAKRVFMVRGAAVVLTLLFLTSKFRNGYTYVQYIAKNKTCIFIRVNARFVILKVNINLYLLTQYFLKHFSVYIYTYIFKEAMLCEG